MEIENVISHLMRLSISEFDGLSEAISRKFLENFAIGFFPKQKEFASSLFVSESVITKFCQKLGYSGFRQFNEFIKLEYQKYLFDRKNIIGDQKIIKMMLETSLENVNENHEFIEQFRKEVYEKKTLTVLPSYQAENVGNFLRDYLIDKKIKVNL
jgi:DNA-binding MurR/RpiR family transcriptional regulator